MKQNIVIYRKYLQLTNYLCLMHSIISKGGSLVAKQLTICVLDHTRPSIKTNQNNITSFLENAPWEPEVILSEDNIKNILF